LAGRSHWRAQDADILAGEHGIEDVSELGIPIPDQELKNCHALVEIHQRFRAC
jgi:hypothetical protein